MELRVLGPIEVVDDDGRASPVTGRSRRLLTVLVLRRGQVVGRDELADLVWGGDPPPTATTALRGSIQRLRDHLDPGRRAGACSILRQDGDGWRLAPEIDQVDADRFERAVRPASATATGTATATDVERWRAALDLWRGPALAEVRDELDEARAAAVRLDELRLEVLGRCLDRALEQGAHAAVVGELRGLVETHPYDERFVRQLMVALHRDGRQADALAVFEGLRVRLLEDLGIRPGPAVDALHRLVLAGDRALDHPLALPGPAARIEDRVLVHPCGARRRDRGRHPRPAA